MNKIKKLVPTLFLTLLFCLGGSSVAMAGVDLGIVGTDGKDMVSTIETVEPGTEQCLLFKTSSKQTEYKFIFENVNADKTSFNMAIYINGDPNTQILSYNFSVGDKDLTDVLTLSPNTDYYIDLTNSAATDNSVVPEVKITITGPKSDTLTLNNCSLLLKKGDKSTLKADYTTNNTNKTLIWKSSNTKVAKVNSKGVVTAVDVGTASITCTSKTDGNRKAICKISVVTNATNITISKKTTSIEEGSNISLSASVKPSGAKYQPIIWKSSDNSIATVSEKGVVTGIKKGTARITATVQFRSKKTVIATCKVTVKESTAKDKSDVEITNGRGNDNVSMTYQYAAGSCYSATGYYTLKVGSYKGDLEVTFHLTSGSDKRTITVVPNSTYYLTYTYTFNEDKGTVVLVPHTTYQLDPITHTMKEVTTYTNSTIPAASTDSDLSATVSGKTCKNIVSAAGSFEKGEFTYEKK